MENVDAVTMWRIIAISAIIFNCLLVIIMGVSLYENRKLGYFKGLLEAHKRIVKLPKITRFTVDCEINKMIDEKATDEVENLNLHKSLELQINQNGL